MRKQSFDISGFLFTLLVGTVLHFVYEWSGQNYIAGFFAPVNESVWEHAKLIAVPAFFWCLGSFLFHMYDYMIYVPAASLGIVSGVAFMIVAYYTYTGIAGTNYPAFDVLIFILSVYLVFYVIQKTAGMGTFPTPTAVLSLIVLILLLVCIALFTIYPPQLNLFVPPKK